jgi:hypothetical protein
MKPPAGQDTALRVIEIALVGGHDICFTPYEGSPWGYAGYDIHKLSGASRLTYDHHIMSISDRDPKGLIAAQMQIDALRIYAMKLSELAEMAYCNLFAQSSALNCQVAPISVVDLILPAPREPIERQAARIVTARQRVHVIGSLDNQAKALLENWAAAVNPNDDTLTGGLLAASSIQALCEEGNLVTRIALAEALSYSRAMESQ